MPQPSITLLEASCLREFGDPTRLSCGIVAGALQLRTEAAAPDELSRNQWTNCSGNGGLFAPESVDEFNRNGWTIWVGICRQVGLR